MSKVFFNVSMSLDGYLVPVGMDMAHAGDPSYLDWGAQWGKLQSWILPQKFFREMLKLGEGGETGRDNEVAEGTFRRTGVSIMGKRMFDLGERMWPEEAPFHSPVYVLTKTVRASWVRPGGTTFYFVNDGIESALHQARAAAGGKDIRIAGGAHAIQQYVNAGLVDEINVAVSPVMFGGGRRLFEEIDRKLSLEIIEAIPSPRVTHLRYAVRKG
ncbi:dihydrofolate reductase family protein [Pendulispora rubella]|uniref:Dihydrofolate reductase family protein n=1 Tax=Pendulispora rubella TaxID=2741070 RepID=A0ABZ2L5W5_9BACT